jgi:TonB family protein
MAHSLPPSPTSAQAEQGLPGSRRQLPSDSDESSAPQTPEQVVAALLTAITGGNLDLGSSLERIALAAHRLTGAEGAAIAMLQGGLVICRARSGSLAPQLGTPLSVDSGISGECLRTGQSMRCDDTNKDLRVDAEVCRRLGLRSIAVVPIRGTHRVVGILEAFSSRPYSFPDRHLQLMTELADLAATARSAHRKKTRAASPQPQSATFIEARPPSILARLHRAAASANLTIRRSTPVLAVTSAAALGLVALIGLGWLYARGHSAQTSPPPTTAHAAVKPSAETLPPGASAALIFNGAAAPDLAPPQSRKPSPFVPARNAPEGSNSSPASLVEKASQIQALPATGAPEASGTAGSPPGPATSAPTGNATQSSTPPKTDESAPALASVVSPEPAALGTVLSAPPEVPRSLPISQGITDGTVIHRVQPIYPELARQSKLQGRVVLQAVITEDGNVRDLKVVSGHPVLARAAQDAVAQWRYRPYLLNGKPVSMATEIKLDFKLP